MRQQINKEFYFLVSAINKAANKGRANMFFKNFTNHTSILSFLVRQGFIISYQLHKKFIFIKLRSGLKPAMHVEKAKRVDRKDFTIELKDLKKVHQREGTVSLYALNTDRGLVTSLDAIEKGIGGQLLFKIR